MPTIDELRMMQAQPLERKIVMTTQRIREWVTRYGEDGVYISFSGGKDSTVLLDIVRNVCGYKNIPAMFVDVPTQFPELKAFAEKFDNVEIVKPKMSFYKVCDKYGFPLISKEVAESVQCARNYLTEILANDNRFDRQTDRQMYADQRSLHRVTKRGNDDKYRRLRGIGEYSQRKIIEPRGRSEFASGDNVGNFHEGQEESDKGEYP